MTTLKDVSQDPTEPSAFNAANASKRMNTITLKAEAAFTSVKAASDDYQSAARKFMASHEVDDYEAIAAKAEKIFDEVGVLLAHYEGELS